MSESDVVERLRLLVPSDSSGAAIEAADEIVRLRVENDALAKSCAAATENNERLCAEVERLNRLCDPMLSSADLRAVDRHCDWVAFGHAYRAMLNARAALGDTHE